MVMHYMKELQMQERELGLGNSDIEDFGKNQCMTEVHVFDLW